MKKGGNGLGLPRDTEMRLFVYGNLKPGELGYDLIREYISDPRPAEVPGHIQVRDGVPLANLKSGSGRISGYILTMSREGYEQVP